jgi:NAD(P)-dependent dehydrogenase (short-subunit alcohol dehydrogenase family)
MADQDILSGRTAIVTGAASGMGRVMARALAGAGARVAGVDIDAGGLDRLAAEPVFAGKLLKIVTDVSQTSACRDAVQKVADTHGGLDILINCAGISMFAAGKPTDSRVKFYETNPEGWQRILAINTIGSFLMARFAAPMMIERGWGRIINVTTSFDTMMAAGLSAYGASKAALEAGSAIWAKDLTGTGVSVNILVPGGPTETDGFFPPGRPRPPVLLHPDIMGVPVVWLASTASDGISGCRFIARDWDAKLPPAEAAARVQAPIAWPDLAKGATAARGHAM